MALFIAIMAIFHIAESLRTRNGTFIDHPTSENTPSDMVYTFEMFVQEFGRAYVPGSEEYMRRAAIFQDSSSQISFKNSHVDRSWTAGVHPFMDWTVAERQGLFGYKPLSHRNAGRPLLASAQEDVIVAHVGQVYGELGEGFETASPKVRNQGKHCGSCWAFSAAEAVEAQLKKANASWGDRQLSPQAMLDCVENPKRCGGHGGCDGANSELAFDFMKDVGVPYEKDLAFRPSRVGKCPMKQIMKGERVRIAGWMKLPSNQAQPLMRALVHVGPAVVVVAAQTWYQYKSGIFDDCPKDPNLEHIVLTKGYGSHRGMKYWLIQNSWGTKWGEKGDIRLFRNNDEDSACGTDYHHNPDSEWIACDDGPQRVEVCGSCGILWDPVVPHGAFIMPAPHTEEHASASSLSTSIGELAHAADFD